VLFSGFCPCQIFNNMNMTHNFLTLAGTTKACSFRTTRACSSLYENGDWALPITHTSHCVHSGVCTTRTASLIDSCFVLARLSCRSNRHRKLRGSTRNWHPPSLRALSHPLMLFLLWIRRPPRLSPPHSRIGPLLGRYNGNNPSSPIKSRHMCRVAFR